MGSPPFPRDQDPTPYRHLGSGWGEGTVSGPAPRQTGGAVLSLLLECSLLRECKHSPGLRVLLYIIHGLLCFGLDTMYSAGETCMENGKW